MNIMLDLNLELLILKQTHYYSTNTPNLIKSHIPSPCHIIKERITTMLLHDQIHYLKRKHAPNNILIGLNTTHTNDIIT